ncbi:MarR family transcriptional regulator [Marinobacter nanhaiticus D15-8W]|uniref:MarR family transcriptional regulator n=1 Tax=Marinobacter nanhaiticus D15-8W TaxID=626887 RepID=N6VYD1_9GAMM|nr:MarR family winged helix-turn-helix transcriptional regulator [Marinobacter nanhaiticus]ENO15245.1 MarR family transcriptional regulator [Marinobacter nanhaiticus D15-8W]
MPRSPSEPLQRLTHAYRSRLRQTILEHRIPLPSTHIRVLKGVCRNPQCTAQSIAERMFRDKAQITRVIKDLLDRNLIIRIPNPDDRRSQLLRPTDQGQALMERIDAIEGQVTAEMTHNIGKDELETFVRLAHRMVDNLGQQPDASSPPQGAHHHGDPSHGQT